MDVINSTIINSSATFEGGAFYSSKDPVIIAGSRASRIVHPFGPAGHWVQTELSSM